MANVLSRYDTLNAGVLDSSTFTQVMTAELSLPESLVNQLIALFDIRRSNNIHYKLLIADLDVALCLEGVRGKRKQIKGELKQLD